MDALVHLLIPLKEPTVQGISEYAVQASVIAILTPVAIVRLFV